MREFMNITKALADENRIRALLALSKGELCMQTTMQKVKPTVLILCTGNSCRSHLAEGILHAALGDSAIVQSAGSKAGGLCPSAGHPGDEGNWH
jgi:DNA-binding transcriptional ArsR family regulator